MTWIGWYWIFKYHSTNNTNWNFTRHEILNTIGPLFIAASHRINVLIDALFHPVITDFGLSKFYDINDYSFHDGTTQYKAPKVLKELEYGIKADVYSFRIIMYEVVTDSNPYPELVDEREQTKEENN